MTLDFRVFPVDNRPDQNTRTLDISSVSWGTSVPGTRTPNCETSTSEFLEHQNRNLNAEHPLQVTLLCHT